MADEKLSWVLELKAQGDGASKMVASLAGAERALGKAGTATGKLEGDVIGLGRALQRGGGWFREFGAAAASSFTGMFAAQAAWDTLKAGVRVIGDLAGAAVHAADEEEKLGISFDFMLGKAQREVTFEWLDRLGRVIPGTDDDLKKLTRTLLASGVPMEGMERTVLGISDIAAVTGESVDGVTEAFGRMMISGDVNSRMLMKLKMTEKEALAPLAKALGKPFETVKDMLSKGKIDRQELRESVLKAFADKSGGVLGAVSVAAGATLLERTKDLKDAGEDLLRDVVMKFGPSVADGIQSLTEAIGPDGTLGPQLMEMIDGIGKTLKSIDWVGGAQSMVTMLKVAAATVDGIVKALGVVSKLIDLLPGAGNGVSKDFVGKTKAAESLNAEAPSALPPRTFWEELAPFMGRKQREDAEFEERKKRAPSRYKGGVLENASTTSPWGGMLGKAEDFGAAGGAAVEKGIRDKTETHSPSRRMETVGRDLMDGLRIGMGGGVSLPAPSSFAPLRTGSGMGPVEINIPITVNVDGHAGGDTGGEIADRIRSIMPGALTAALEQMRAQVGA